jgi:hypothetical protein
MRSQLRIVGPSPYLFPRDKNSSGCQTRLKTVWHKTLKRAKIPYFRIYDLRSTYATRLSAGGIADKRVTQLLRQGDAKVFNSSSIHGRNYRRSACSEKGLIQFEAKSEFWNGCSAKKCFRIRRATQPWLGRKPRRRTVWAYNRSLAPRAASQRAVPAVPDGGVSLAVVFLARTEARAGSPPGLRRRSLPAPTPATGVAHRGRSPERSNARIPPGSELDVGRQASIDKALGVGDCPFVERGDPGRERVHERVQVGIGQGAIHVAVGLGLLSPEVL